MSNSNNNKSTTAQKNKKPSPINILFKPINVAIGIVFYIALSIIVGVIVEWCGMAVDLWSYSHAERVLRQEFAYLGNNFSTTLFGVSAQDAALTVINTLNDWLHNPIENSSSSTGRMISARWFESVWRGSTPYINAVIYIIMITGIRCVIITLSIALFLIVGLAAVVDGLHIRELRKVGGDNEHGDVYHWAKASVPKIIILSPVIYLAWPGAINPNFVLLPGMTLFFIAIFQLFSKYKKVL